MPEQQPSPSPAPAPEQPPPEPQPRREWTDRDVPAPGKEHHGEPPGSV